VLVCVVRGVLDGVGSRTVAVEDYTLRSYVGGWPEYVRVREERQEAERQAKRAKPPAARKPAPPPAGPSKNAKQQAQRLEAEIEAAEATLRALEEELADPSAWNDPRSAEKSTRRHAEAKRRLEALYARWETVAG
jgi:ATP-binding cassette subfamily F protein 3